MVDGRLFGIALWTPNSTCSLRDRCHWSDNEEVTNLYSNLEIIALTDAVLDSFFILSQTRSVLWKWNLPWNPRSSTVMIDPSSSATIEQIYLISQFYCSLHLKLLKLCTMVAPHDIERRQFNLQSGRDQPPTSAFTIRTLSYSRTMLFTRVESMAIRVENSNPPICRWW